jgi:hypothetical protein
LDASSGSNNNYVACLMCRLSLNKLLLDDDVVVVVVVVVVAAVVVMVTTLMIIQEICSRIVFPQL